VNELVARAAALVDGYARERGAQLRLELAPHLPSIAGNGVEIEQVFVKLLRNALESGGSMLEVEVRTAGLDDRVRVTVSDTGSGIPLEARARVFEPFFSTKRAVGGTGLGLAIARRIVADHGGDIRVEDRATRGTCFAVELPFSRAGPS
jgi:signal transduction histidine kinase